MASAKKLSQLLLEHFEHGELSSGEQPIASNGEAISATPDSPNLVSVRGILNLSHQTTITKAVANCTFFVSDDWRKVAPLLQCSEPWICRPGGTLTTNWHIRTDGLLCYVLDAEWEDALRNLSKKTNGQYIGRVAAFYAINNARWLLYHHLLGYRDNLTDWPPDWPQRSHSTEGIIEYMRERFRSLPRRLRRAEARKLVKNQKNPSTK